MQCNALFKEHKFSSQKGLILWQKIIHFRPTSAENFFKINYNPMTHLAQKCTDPPAPAVLSSNIRSSRLMTFQVFLQHTGWMGDTSPGAAGFDDQEGETS